MPKTTRKTAIFQFFSQKSKKIVEIRQKIPYNYSLEGERITV